MRRAAHIASLLLAILCLSCISRIDHQKREQSRQHYQKGLELYRQGEVESAVWELEQAVWLDSRFAPAHSVLAEIYIRRGDIRGRWLATKEALKAVTIAPRDPQYRYNLAMIYREREFGYNAKREFRKVLDLDPQFWKAHYQLGLLWEESGLKYESQERHRRAVHYLIQAAHIAPQEHAVLYHLGLNLEEVGRWEESVGYLQRAVEVEPLRYEAYLLLAVAQHQLGKLEEAERSYQEALERMSEEERMPFESLDFLSSSEELEAYQDEDKAHFLRLFWKRRDPTPTTQVNERQLEHYRRVAYANVHFAAPKLDLPGWKSKRGEFYIRYGEPVVKWRELGEVSMGVGLVPPRWFWSYGEEGREVTLTFADTFLNGEYNFPFPNKNWGPADFRNSPATIAQRLIETLPEDYQHDYGGEPLEFAYRTVEYRGYEGMTDLELIYGIRNIHLEFSRSGQMAEALVERRAVLFDLDWNEVARTVEEQSFQVPPTQATNPNRIVVEKAEFQVPAGNYWLALNIRDQESKRVGIVKAEVEVAPYDNQTLAISSLVLANRLPPAEEAERFSRGDLAVIPRLSRYFQASQPLMVYYEIYNLTRDRRGDTWYQTEYTISRHPEKRGFLSQALSAISSPFRGKQKWESVSSITEYWGDSATEIGKLEVDMSKAELGEYQLRLTVTDMNSGQRAEREVAFRLVE
jgi:GWxTD domain-containing protein